MKIQNFISAQINKFFGRIFETFDSRTFRPKSISALVELCPLLEEWISVSFWCIFLDNLVIIQASCGPTIVQFARFVAGFLLPFFK